MRRATALKVADTLALVEVWLEQGRPRKRPGKPRAEAIAIAEHGSATLRVTPCSYDNVMYAKVSLVGAFKASVIGEGYTPYIRRLAEEAFVAVVEQDGWLINSVEDLDYWEPDTRQIIRYAKRARRELEKTYGL